MDNLLPCPFCGGEAEIRGSILLFVQCAKCKTRYGDGYHATKAEAIAAWNTRYHSPFEETVIKAWKEIKDYQERTCEVVAYIEHALMDEPNSFEFSCGHTFESFDVVPPNYCPNCGAKVVS